MAKARFEIHRCLCVVGFLLCAPSVWASNEPGCEAQVRVAELNHGIPSGLLVAIARTESGRRHGNNTFGAWPWTLNVQGRGHYFANRAEAREKLESVIDEGVRSVDVGCLQINYRWHGQEFAGVDAMLDPATNADYAARYLKSLRDQYGSWDTAVAYYHSRDPDRGSAYRQRVVHQQNKLTQASATDKTVSPVVSTDAPAAPLPVQIADTGKARGNLTTDSRFQNRLPLISVPRSSDLASNPDLPRGNFPKPLSEVRLQVN